MEIEEAKSKKESMERSIAAIIKEYETKTGAEVVAIDFERLHFPTDDIIKVKSIVRI